ncbi:MAG: BMP family ABC transporter substrate-binding protein [Ruminococcaceae bacterium]|nr:BMP family ABC transporter substrate-binding protein [Oscillospiraceae bacterium]
MKKLFAILLIVMMLFTACADAQDETPAATQAETIPPEHIRNLNGVQIALIAEGSVQDDLEAQASWQTIEAFCGTNSLPYGFYNVKDYDYDMETAVDAAVTEGYNVIVLPSYYCAQTVNEKSPQYPEVKFIARGLRKDDMLMECYPDQYFGYEDAGPLPQELPEYLNNVAFLNNNSYANGYMVGYAAVYDGYRSLGLSGYMMIPAEYAYGIVQGAQAAAAELQLTEQVCVYTSHGNCFCDKAYTDPIYALAENGADAIIADFISLYAMQMCYDVAKEYEVDFLACNQLFEGEAQQLAFMLQELAQGEWERYGGQFTALGNSRSSFLGFSEQETAQYGVPTSLWMYEALTREQLAKRFDQIVVDYDPEADYYERLENYNGPIHVEGVYWKHSDE